MTKTKIVIELEIESDDDSGEVRRVVNKILDQGVLQDAIDGYNESDLLVTSAVARPGGRS